MLPSRLDKNYIMLVSSGIEYGQGIAYHNSLLLRAGNCQFVARVGQSRIDEGGPTRGVVYEDMLEK